MTRTHGLLLAGATAVISGVAVFLNGYGVAAWRDVADATTYTTAKNVVAALILIVVVSVLAIRRSGEAPRRPRGAQQWIGCGLVATLGGSIPFVLFFEGLARADSVQAAFIHKTLIIWVAVLATVFLGERIGAAHIGAIGLLVLGQAILIGGIGGMQIGVGEVLILAATLLWSVEVVIAKRLLADVPPATLSVARMAGGAVLLGAFVAYRGIPVDTAALSWHHLLWVAATGVVLAGYVASWHLALARAPAVDVTAVLVGGALITAFLRTGVQGIPLPEPVGLALIAVGLGLLFLTQARRLVTR
jgi:drug/metabolite transporter (DMT)-like permease